jgi:TP901 family phage tail tape measure protein
VASSGNIRAGRAYVELYSDNNKLSRGLKAAQAKIRNFSRSVNILGRQMLAASMIMAAPLVGGTKIYADFEQQMAQVSTMLDNPAEYMDTFRQGIRDMAVEFGEGTDTLAKGLYDILSASIDPAKALDVLAVSAKAAKAGLTDTGIAADAITTILNSYGLSADHAQSVSDLLFATVKRGKTTFAELAPSIGLVATTAASAGIGLEEVGAALATMTRNGVKTDNAVTALNAILSSFLKPEKDAAEYARSLGFEMSSVTLKAEGLRGVFNRIKNLPPDAVSKLFPNIRALRGVLPALKNMTGYAQDIDVMKNRAGLTDSAFAKMAKTLTMLGGKLKQLGILALSYIGEALADELQKAGKAILDVGKFIVNFIRNNKALVVTIAKVTIGVALVSGILLALGSAAGLVAFALGGLASIIGGLATAIGFVVSIIGGLVSFAALFLSWPLLIASAVTAAVAAFVDWGKVLEWVKTKLAPLKDKFFEIWNAIKGALMAGDFAAAFKVVTASVKLIWDKFVLFLADKWDWVITNFLLAIAGLGTPFRRTFTALAGSFVTAWIHVKNWFKNFWEWLLLKFRQLKIQKDYYTGGISAEERDIQLKTVKGYYDHNTGVNDKQAKQELADHEAEVQRRMALSDEDYISEVLQESKDRLNPFQQAVEDSAAELKAALTAAKKVAADAEKKINDGEKIKNGKTTGGAGTAISNFQAISAGGSFSGFTRVFGSQDNVQKNILDEVKEIAKDARRMRKNQKSTTPSFT